MSYADLNLATPKGGKELEKRVHDTTKETCQELDRNYPLTEPGPGSKDCFERAKDDGMRQAQDAIRMAKRQPVAVETD